ncbi:hypothetical protein CCAX7_32740 [Capsulimonas corticalis]|uniref:Tc1-like transposase DDE domain-containing protein n=1 Tax=Capsulimonas corticalis TaxID=2219043 RepID=A0A9N7L5J4_9BACT|nr:IS630 family transposase [Capsulimonas corticalis]BDI31223.1 hypothetical protein CCAX7_32740 [Capsulimonas corticalis]
MGPEAAKTYPGKQLVRTPQVGDAAIRAKYEADYGRRGKGYFFGAFIPATGQAFTAPYERRTGENWVCFLEQVDQWEPCQGKRVLAITDNLGSHLGTDAQLFSAEHAHWEFVFTPKYAPYLNLIEPWWKILRSLALKGRRFETFEQICTAVEAATDYWNHHRHPFQWGHRRRHLHHRQPGIAQTPTAVAITR